MPRHRLDPPIGEHGHLADGQTFLVPGQTRSYSEILKARGDETRELPVVRSDGHLARLVRRFMGANQKGRA